MDLITLIDNWISCSKDTGDKKLDEIVKAVQVHKHTKKSCLKRGNGCRFDFPRPPSQRTLISRPINELFPEESDEEQQLRVEAAKGIMTYVKQALEDLEDDCEDYYDNDLEKFLAEKCDEICTIEEYHDALQISACGGNTVILRRKVSERNVNNYNPNFQKPWNGNTDIQLCLDSFAVVTYITDYLTKADHGLTKLLITALKEKRDADRFELLNHLKRTYFTHTQTCICEAAYRLIPGLDLKGATTKCLFVASGFKDKRKMYLYEVPDNEDEPMISPDDHMTKIPKKQSSSTKYKKVKTMGDKKFLIPQSKHDKYEFRPEDIYCNVTHGAFEMMCFAEFCLLYDYNNQTDHNICWHPIAINEGIHECENSHADIEELFKPKSVKSKGKDKPENDKQEEDKEQEDFEDECEKESEEEESNPTSTSTKKINLDGWRWGNRKWKKGEEPICEVGYTRNQYNLMRKKKNCHEFLKYKIGEEEMYLPQWIRLGNNRTMKLRTKPYILRMYSYPKDLVQKKYSELILFTHWRKEETFWLADEISAGKDDPNSDNGNQENEDHTNEEECEKKRILTFDDAEFELKIQNLSNNEDIKKEWQTNRTKIYPYSRKIEEIKKLMESDDFQRSKNIYDSINPQAEQENAENAEDLELPDEEDEFPDLPESDYSTKRKKKPQQKDPLVPEKCIFKKSILPEEKDELHQSVRSLSYEQRVVFDKYIHYFQSIKCVRHEGDIIPEPPKIIVHGKYV